MGATVSEGTAGGSGHDESWRRVLAPYAEPLFARSLLDVATSVVPYFLLLVAMVFALRVSTLLALVLAVPAAGFLLRTFIIFHDCAHNSFFRSKRANALLGAALGVLLFMPFRQLAGTSARRPSRDRGRSRPPRRRGHSHVDRRRVLRSTVVGTARLPALPQPARHVRSGASSGSSWSGRGSSRPPAPKRIREQRPRHLDLCACARRRRRLLAPGLADIPRSSSGRRCCSPRAIFGIWLLLRRPSTSSRPPTGRRAGAWTHMTTRRSVRQLLPQAARSLPVLHRQHRLPPTSTI